MLVEEISMAETRPLRRAILRPHETPEALKGHEPPQAHAVGAFDAGRLVAVGFIAPDGEPGGWRIRGMATAPETRGKGAGTAVLEALIAHALAHGATRIWCNARTPALRLYERAGFSVVSEEFDIPHIGPHFRMERTARRAQA